MGRQLKDLGLSTTLELTLYNFNTKILKFSDIETSLDNVLVTGVMMYDINSLPTKTPSGRPTIDTSIFLMAQLTLCNSKNEIYNKSLPLELFQRVDLNILHLQPKLINIRNSYIELGDTSLAAPLAAGGESFIVTFFYEKFNPNIHTVNGIGELI